MKNNKKGFSIVFALVFVILITLLVIYILEYIIPFGKDVKGIENSSKAYYEANKGVEDSLFYARENKFLNKTDSAGNYEYVLKAKTDPTNTTIPFLAKGDSDYDKDFNIISSGNPVQMEIGNGAISNWSGVKLHIRAPNIDGGGNKILTGPTVLVTWKLISPSGVLDGKLSASVQTEVYNGSLGSLSGKELDGTPGTLETYYNTNCSFGNKCSLKLSVVNEIKSLSGIILPYLEWKIDFTNSNTLPTRFFRVISSGKSGTFKKTLKIKKPQQSVIEAFDFTIIQ
ncbi:hypothetical protein CSB07_01370 [Candidatus Gracilibacteria bacterium]|nr:MAG: hypothetical protein CSB07_01370 [Candidatus Gracilibacteria bacterium]PIE85070.1 MAG: hypothetical protein CSA08_03965 [Candidatus Gracilibacteria bacterium]